jgi:hypothetical protein
MSEQRSDHVSGFWLVVFTLVTWVLVLMLQGCAGSGSSDTRHATLVAAAMSYCTELCLPFGVLYAGPAPSPDGASPFTCECMPAGYEIPDEEPEKKPDDDPEQQRIAALDPDR